MSKEFCSSAGALSITLRLLIGKIELLAAEVVAAGAGRFFRGMIDDPALLPNAAKTVRKDWLSDTSR